MLDFFVGLNSGGVKTIFVVLFFFYRRTCNLPSFFFMCVHDFLTPFQQSPHPSKNKNKG